MEILIHDIPKAELHLHIEGSLEPEMMFKLAGKNGIRLPFKSVTDLRQAYDFTDLQSFLDIYYQGTQVLIDEDDFYQVTWAYLQKAAKQNVRHTEVFFDPQAHTSRGIKFETLLKGIHRAQEDAEWRLNLSSKLIMCFLRDRDIASAMETLEEALPFSEWIIGVGLDSSERGFPPRNFTELFEKARRAGFKTVAHAGEEGPPDYIWQALNDLKVERIDHGVRCVEDTRLLEHLVKKQIPLTVCPLSNVRLRVFENMRRHNLKQMLDLGLCVSVNSDDPAYFGGYIEENFRALHHAHCLEPGDIIQLSRNAFRSSFLKPREKKKHLDKLNNFACGAGVP